MSALLENAAAKLTDPKISPVADFWKRQFFGAMKTKR
jgi:hypothetical protein